MIVYDKAFLKHHMEGHPESKERLIRTFDFLTKKGVFEKLSMVSPKPAEEKDILRVHSKAHLEDMRSTKKKGLRVLGDTYFTGDTYDTALLAAGGVLTCLNDKNKKSFALVRPPGHHATVGAAMGFCIFNNVAVGAAYAREKGFKRIAILDFDLHHGNGTQDIFYNDDVLYISLHQWPHYPGTGSIDEIGYGKGEGYTINIPLPEGASDQSYRRALNEVVFPILKSFSPDLLLASAGYDSHFTDPLGGMLLSTRTYLDLAERCKGLAKKVVFSLEGGYDLISLPHCIYASLQGLFDLPEDPFDSEQKEDKRISDYVETNIGTIIKRVSNYWGL